MYQYDRDRKPTRGLRGGNALNYVQFVHLIKYLWEEYHPDIPMFPDDGPQRVDYPCITFQLENKQPVAGEPKLRPRHADPNSPQIITAGQKFLHIVSFSIYTKANPVLADQIIDEFEDFMLEITPIIKSGGVQEIFYNRRFPDADLARKDTDVTKRTVAYNVTLEKIVNTTVPRLERIKILVHQFLETESATPGWGIEHATPVDIPVKYLDSIESATPSD